MASVRKLPSGNYQGIANYRDPYGNRHQKSFTARQKSVALQLAEEYEAVGRDDPPIGLCIDNFIAFKSPVLSPSTVRGYSAMARAIKTRYGAFCALTRPSQRDAQGIVSLMLSEGISPKTVKSRINLIAAAVKFNGGQFPRVSLPKVSVESDFIPSEELMEKITGEVAGTSMEIPVALGMMGLRRSEICGLSPSDLEGNRLHIHTALVMGDDKKHHLKDTKTQKSDRYIILPDELAKKMRGWRCTLSPMAITHAFRKITHRLGVRCRFHDLRHFFVSYCHNVLKLSDAQIMKLGGWASDSIMKRHYLQSMHDQETAELVADAFGKFVPPNVQQKSLKCGEISPDMSKKAQ